MRVQRASAQIHRVKQSLAQPLLYCPGYAAEPGGGGLSTSYARECGAQD
jgi:hypothetical protein